MNCLSPIVITHPTLRKDPIEFREKYLLSAPDFPRYLVVPCGKCAVCRKKRASEWAYRMRVEMQHYAPRGTVYIRRRQERPRHGGSSWVDPHRNARVYFGTLTVDSSNIDSVSSDPAMYLRRFFERYRKIVGKSLRHWVVTDLGGVKGRFHFHFLFFDCDYRFLRPLPRGERFELSNGYVVTSSHPAGELVKLWQYGEVFIEPAEGPAAASYISKYMLSEHPLNPDFVPAVYCSPGLGRSLVTDEFLRYWRTGDKIPVFMEYDVRKGVYYRIALPRYYCNKIWDSDDRVNRSLISHFDGFKPIRCPDGSLLRTELEYVRYMQSQRLLHGLYNLTKILPNGRTVYEYWYAREIELLNQ
ncbi:replication initiator protein [Microvirus mar35]|uniref:Replication initiator protein n=1 Tax=Microvirus mar35 TaxID=2851169 RepID=A0A8F5RCR1_9VIRU|nr:replication initiator protein [Microvirus mar35]